MRVAIDQTTEAALRTLAAGITSWATPGGAAEPLGNDLFRVAVLIANGTAPVWLGVEAVDVGQGDELFRVAAQPHAGGPEWQYRPHLSSVHQPPERLDLDTLRGTQLTILVASGAVPYGAGPEMDTALVDVALLFEGANRRLLLDARCYDFAEHSRVVPCDLVMSTDEATIDQRLGNTQVRTL